MSEKVDSLAEKTEHIHHTGQGTNPTSSDLARSRSVPNNDRGFALPAEGYSDGV
jgi:hypothetical protein